MEETSETHMDQDPTTEDSEELIEEFKPLRLQILENGHGTKLLQFLWPDEDKMPEEELDEEGVRETGTITVDIPSKEESDLLLVLQSLDYKTEGEVRLLIESIATAVWEAAKESEK